MKKTLNTGFLLLLFLCLTFSGRAQELREKLAALKGVSGIEKVESDHFKEKYLLRLTQQVDPKDPSVGTFQQRVFVFHAGYDRPTVMVTEGYGAQYAMFPRYTTELARLLDTNIIVVEYRYFLESTPNPCNWDYLTAENSAYDLHHVRETLGAIYPGKWITTGASKGGQTTCLYRAFFPDDVDFSVPYVAPLCRNVEDGRHEPFLRKVGTKAERKRILDFQKEVLKRKSTMVPLLREYANAHKFVFRTSLEEILDYCVLEYPFAFWQYGSPIDGIPALSADDKTLFDYLMKISSPSYYAENQGFVSFNVQAARELGYYGYDTKPFKGLLTITTAKGFLNRLMLPKELVDKVPFRPELYHKIYNFLKDNDPKMIFIYGEVDPWTAARVPTFKGKKNEQIYIQPGGNHGSHINTLKEADREKVIAQMKAWLAE